MKLRGDDLSLLQNPVRSAATSRFRIGCSRLLCRFRGACEPSMDPTVPVRAAPKRQLKRTLSPEGPFIFKPLS